MKGAEGNGVYFGHPFGFAFTDQEITIAGSRKGILKTPVQTSKVVPFVPGEGAVLYYFERQGENSNQFKIYCLDTDGTTKKYLKQNDTSLVFTTSATAATVFTFTENTTSGPDFNKPALTDIDFSNTWDIESNGYYLTSQNGNKIENNNNKGKAFAAWAEHDGWMPMCFWYYEKKDTDPYGLNGKTVALLNTKGGDAGRTLQSTPLNSTNLASLQVAVVTKTGTSHMDKLYVSAEDNATMWTFTWVREDMYYLQDESGKYLTITSSGLSMSTTPTT